jgi:hypothetical protein
VLFGCLLPTAAYFATALALLFSTAAGENYHILMVREGSADAASGLPSGRLVIDAGFLDGVSEGMSGVVWRKNKFQGQIDVADFEVTEVTPYDAACSYTVKHPSLYVLKKDRASLTPAVSDEADILARGITALEKRECFQALLFFERIFCANRDNAFVQQQIAECRRQVEQRLSGGLSEDERRRVRAAMWDDLEIAQGHHEYKNDLAADMYVKIALAADSTNATASALRDSIPQQDMSALFSPERCK